MQTRWIVLAVALAVLAFAPAAAAAPTIAIVGEPAFCQGSAIEPVNGVYIMQAGCVLNLQFVWPLDLVSAKPQISSDQGQTWTDSTVAEFPPATPGLVSGAAFDPCNWPGPGRWLFRVHGVDSGNADVYSDTFPYSVSACEANDIDRTPPTLNVPVTVGIDATSAAGAVVVYEVSATDDIDPTPAVACSPASRTLFAIGDSTVNCSATDSSGNQATASFVVHVRSAKEQVDQLQSAVMGVGRGGGLAAIVGGMERLLELGQTGAACAQLGAFQALVGVESSAPVQAIAPGTAASLIANAKQIANVLSC
jgi:hypothetical protein